MGKLRLLCCGMEAGAWEDHQGRTRRLVLITCSSVTKRHLTRHWYEELLKAIVYHEVGNRPLGTSLARESGGRNHTSFYRYLEPKPESASLETLTTETRAIRTCHLLFAHHKETMFSHWAQSVYEDECGRAKTNGALLIVRMPSGLLPILEGGVKVIDLRDVVD